MSEQTMEREGQNEREVEALERYVASKADRTLGSMSHTDRVDRFEDIKRDTLKALGGWRRHLSVDILAPVTTRTLTDILHGARDDLTQRAEAKGEDEAADFFRNSKFTLSGATMGGRARSSDEPSQAGEVVQFIDLQIFHSDPVLGDAWVTDSIPVKLAKGQRVARAWRRALVRWLALAVNGTVGLHPEASKAGRAAVYDPDKWLALADRTLERMGQIRQTGAPWVVTLSAAPSTFARIGTWGIDINSCLRHSSDYNPHHRGMLAADPGTVVVMAYKFGSTEARDLALQAAGDGGPLACPVVWRAWGKLLAPDTGILPFAASNWYGSDRRAAQEVLSTALGGLGAVDHVPVLADIFTRGSVLYTNNDTQVWALKGKKCPTADAVFAAHPRHPWEQLAGHAFCPACSEALREAGHQPDMVELWDGNEVCRLGAEVDGNEGLYWLYEEGRPDGVETCGYCGHYGQEHALVADRYLCPECLGNAQANGRQPDADMARWARAVGCRPRQGACMNVDRWEDPTGLLAAILAWHQRRYPDRYALALAEALEEAGGQEAAEEALRRVVADL